jgi:hypothetical protein
MQPEAVDGVALPAKGYDPRTARSGFARREPSTIAGDTSNARTCGVKTQRARRTQSSEGEPVLCALRALCVSQLRGAVWRFLLRGGWKR